MGTGMLATGLTIIFSVFLSCAILSKMNKTKMGEAV
jgi:hypothetical protein